MGTSKWTAAQVTENPAHKPTVGKEYEHVTYVSHCLETNQPVLAVLEVDGEPVDYQTARLLDGVHLIELWAGGINFGPALSKTTASIIESEAIAHLIAKKRREAEEAHSEPCWLTSRPAVGAVKLEPARVELSTEQFAGMDSMAGIAA